MVRRVPACVRSCRRLHHRTQHEHPDDAVLDAGRTRFPAHSGYHRVGGGSSEVIRTSRILGALCGLRPVPIAISIALTFCLAACDPPGKPKGEEPANVNRLDVAD